VNVIAIHAVWIATGSGISELQPLPSFQVGAAPSIRQFAERYLRRLADLPVDLPARAPGNGMHAWHLFPIRIRPEAGVSRDDVISLLASRGIGTSVHYRPLHQMTYWRSLLGGRSVSFPMADRYFAGAVTLPLYPAMREAEADEVVSVLKEALSVRRK
jgi:dTDP-4-amino-4,6-dideoxygalactose transaminase